MTAKAAPKHLARDVLAEFPEFRNNVVVTAKYISDWSRRNGYSTQRTTHKSSPGGTEQEKGRIKELFENYHREIELKKIPLCLQFNMDETKVETVSVSRTTLHKKNSGPVICSPAESSIGHVTAVLGCSYTGVKMPGSRLL